MICKLFGRALEVDLYVAAGTLEMPLMSLMEHDTVVAFACVGGQQQYQYGNRRGTGLGQEKAVSTHVLYCGRSILRNGINRT